MIPVTELIAWLQTLPADSQVGVDDGGLTLLCDRNPDTWFEVGGMVIPLTERPELSALLAELRQLDANGWCVVTDGSHDYLTTEEVIEFLTQTLANIKKG